jgi:hypothetical protein
MGATYCPGCQALLPEVDGPTHRYLGASPACWAIYTAMSSGGEPPLALGPWNGLLVDAYAAQHPGEPSDQAIQSVAVHLLALYGVLAKGLGVDRVLWIRQTALAPGKRHKHERFIWLAPPSFAGSLSVADIVQGATPRARSEILARYVQEVWARWSRNHLATLSAWYAAYVAPGGR